jgi:virulence factor Mce-like protein
MKSLSKLLIPAILLTVAVVATVLVLFGGEDDKIVTAKFPRTISIYEGSEVRILGVTVGTVDSVTPKGTEVEVVMSYDSEIDVPAEAEAVIIAPSVVGDRFIQLTPAYESGPKLQDGAVLELASTSTPLELDEIYQSLDELTVALGPDGANRSIEGREGALSRLLRTTAENFEGEGEQFNQTIHDLGTLTGTLDNNREELFGAAARLQDFMGTLAENDQTVRDFNQSMASVSEMLAGEREELAASLRNLATAMTAVRGFVEDNEQLLARDIKGLNRIAKILVRQRGALEEILRGAPVALTNLGLTYNPQAGTLDTRANIGELFGNLEDDPANALCNMLGSMDDGGELCNALNTALPRPGALAGQADTHPLHDPTLGGLVEVAP